MTPLSRQGVSSPTIDEALSIAMPLLQGYGDAMVVYGLIRTKLADALVDEGLAAADIESASSLAYPRAVLTGLLRYAVRAGFAVRRGDRLEASDKLRACTKAAGWFRMLVGGYGPTLLSMAESAAPATHPAQPGTLSVTRNLDEVQAGSCLISHHGAFVVICDMLERLPTSDRQIVVDIGCGDGSLEGYIRRRGVPFRYVGLEDPRFSRLQSSRQAHGAHKQSSVQSSVDDYLGGLPAQDRCVVVLSFVLHEIIAQQGEPALRELLYAFARDERVAALIVVEVDLASNEPRLRDSAAGLGYYNLYYLLHDITPQRLMPCAFWESVFRDCGFIVNSIERMPDEVDPMKLEVAFLLVK